jgi:hypothetical protein
MGYAGKIGAVLQKYGYELRRANAPIKCPFCGHKHFFVDDKRGIFNCRFSGCMVSGGVLDFAYAFYSDVVMVSPRPKNKLEAIRLLEKDLGVDALLPSSPASISDEPEIVECSIEKRHAVYSAMKNICKLTEADIASLLSRGYTKEQIKSFGYCSLPVSKEERYRVARILQSMGLSVKGVPGFMIDDAGDACIANFGFYARKYAFAKESCKDETLAHFLIPSYDCEGHLQFFQIAWDKALCGDYTNKQGEQKEYAKYTMFSTPNSNGGAKAAASCGYVGFYKRTNAGLVPDLRGATTLPVIEGTLKTALYFELSGRKESCISQVGVSNFRALKSFLEHIKEVCPEVVQIDDCYDMDKFTNEDVMAGSKKLKEICEELGFIYHCRKWSSDYKGIDDFALAWKKGMLR